MTLLSSDILVAADADADWSECCQWLQAVPVGGGGEHGDPLAGLPHLPLRLAHHAHKLRVHH